MPRTIDHIVDTHRLARSRVAAGLPVWDRTISIKPILHRDQSNGSEEHAAAVANEIGALLRMRLPAAMLDWNSDDLDEEITEIVESVEQLRPDAFADDPTYSALEELNNRLDELYDWADRERVWLG